MKKRLLLCVWVVLALLFMTLPTYFAISHVGARSVLAGPVYEEVLDPFADPPKVRRYQVYQDRSTQKMCSVLLMPGDVPHREGVLASRPGCTPANLTEDAFGQNTSLFRLVAVIMVAPYWGLLTAILFAISHPRPSSRVLLRLYLAVKLHSKDACRKP